MDFSKLFSESELDEFSLSHRKFNQLNDWYNRLRF